MAKNIHLRKHSFNSLINTKSNIVMNEYSVDSLEDSGFGSSSPLNADIFGSEGELGELVVKPGYSKSTEYISRSYIEMPQTGEVNYISTIIGVSGNPIYKGQGIWVQKSDKSTSTTIKVDKDDIRAKRHYVKTLTKDGREIKIWECGLCGKEFRFQYTLVRHIPTHTDVRNYQCDICPKAFRQLSTLAQHKATHWNMRPFSCDFCNKSFNRISTLISHKKIHYDEKKHVCDYCGKGFHQKGNLRNHMYTHTNERPYKCDICGKGFNQKSNLVCHKISTHSRKDNYQCELCNINFVKHSHFTCHMESIHGVGVSTISATKKPLSSKLWNSANNKSQCVFVDESDNIIYSLPISVDKKRMNLNRNNDSLSSEHKQSAYLENEIVAVIDQEPTNAMLNSFKNKQVPFVLYYASGEIQPKICKADLKRDSYILRNPLDEDISRYFTKNEDDQSSSKFPIVATIFQKKDGFGNIQYLVVPAGIQSRIIENTAGDSVAAAVTDTNCKITLHNVYNDEVVIIPENSLYPTLKTSNRSNDKEKAAVIYTKTQPNQRQKGLNPPIKPENNFSEEDIVFPDDLNITPEIVEPCLEGETNSARVCIYLCSAAENNKTNTETKSLCKSEDTTPNEHCNNDFLLREKDKQPKYNKPADQSYFGQSECSFNNYKKKPVKDEKQLSNTINNIDNIKKEDCSEILPMDEANVFYNDIEPTLFINSDNVREPLSKYNLEFDEENLNLLDAYNIHDPFIENEVNNGITEQGATDYYLSQPDYSASPNYLLHPIL